LGRGNSVQRERIRRGNKASKQVKLTETWGLLLEIQGNRETDTRFVEREPIVVEGARRLRESVGVGEINGNKVSNSSHAHVGE
jgi:hypothetical protein